MEPAAAGGSLLGMECARLPAKGLDEESAGWLRRLGADGGERQAAERELHARLVRIAVVEVRRRSASTPVTGPELDDVAQENRIGLRTEAPVHDVLIDHPPVAHRPDARAYLRPHIEHIARKQH